MDFKEELHLTSRRQLLKGGVAAAALCLLPLPAWARYSFAQKEVRTLSFYNTHTGESLQKVAYWEKGAYVKDALNEINHILRDHRADSVMPIDPALIDLVFDLQDSFSSKGQIEIISGYRSPATNSQLSSKSRGVAKRSYHMQGKAIDLRVPGVPLKNLRQVATQLGRGGVGYYPRSNFVHVDTGPVRHW